jgi:hypothetical protein
MTASRIRISRDPIAQRLALADAEFHSRRDGQATWRNPCVIDEATTAYCATETKYRCGMNVMATCYWTGRVDCCQSECGTAATQRHDDWATAEPDLKTIDDVTYLRRRILLAFEKAKTEHEEAECTRLLTFVVVGGGPTGVEMAGAIAIGEYVAPS